jgi:hypothetical protein
VFFLPIQNIAPSGKILVFYAAAGIYEMASSPMTYASL